MTIKELTKDMTKEEKQKFFKGFIKELEFWGNITKVEDVEEKQ